MERRIAFLAVSILSTLLFNQPPALAMTKPWQTGGDSVLQTYSGGSIDVFTQRGGEGFNSSGGTFAAGEQVDLYANVTYNEDALPSKLVVFEAKDPQGNPILVRTAMTNLTGIAAVSCTLPLGAECDGTWTVRSTVDIAGKTFLDWLSFKGIASLNIPGDLNGDHMVDCTDLGIMGSSWGASRGDPNYIPEADIDNDSMITSTDLGILGTHWCEML